MRTGMEPIFNFKNILISTDFSNYSLETADYAIDIARRYGARLHLLHVIVKSPPILAIRTLDLSEEKINKQLNLEAGKSLDKVVARLKEKTDVEIVAAISRGPAYQEIVSYAEKNDIDLIVIATHGFTGLLHTLIGSVAEKVIRYARCPVLVITPKEQKKKSL